MRSFLAAAALLLAVAPVSAESLKNIVRTPIVSTSDPFLMGGDKLMQQIRLKKGQITTAVRVEGTNKGVTLTPIKISLSAMGLRDALNTKAPLIYGKGLIPARALIARQRKASAKKPTSPIKKAIRQLKVIAGKFAALWK